MTGYKCVILVFQFRNPICFCPKKKTKNNFIQNNIHTPGTHNITLYKYYNGHGYFIFVSYIWVYYIYLPVCIFRTNFGPRYLAKKNKMIIEGLFEWDFIYIRRVSKGLFI